MIEEYFKELYKYVQDFASLDNKTTYIYQVFLQAESKGQFSSWATWLLCKIILFIQTQAT